MAKKSITDLKNEAVAALDAFFSAAADALEGGAVAFTAPAKAEPGSYSRDELEEMDIKTLRDLAKRHSLDTIKKAEIIDALASDEGEDEDEAEEDDEDEEYEEDEDADDDEESDEDEEGDEEDDEEEGYTREELEDMTLRDLRALAREYYDAADVKGLDQDALIDLLLGDDEEDEDADEADDEDEDYEEDESEDEGDEDEEEEDGEEELTEDDLRKMSLAELKEVAGDIGITIPKSVKKDALVDLILESADE